MRLLNTSTLELRNFYNDEIPLYAILSHTWGEDEITFQDLEKPDTWQRPAYSKLTSCCALALRDGWEYIWIDTCCIDKTSSAELSEAINSMYRWYQDAEICYAYMVDMTTKSLLTSKMQFHKSRWFRRGWTLQELLAPKIVVFYNESWKELGTKQSLKDQISLATGIDSRHLADPTKASVAAKMSWAANRRTTRTEDIAYCLMGLFDVNMPLLYGEGTQSLHKTSRDDPAEDG